MTAGGRRSWVCRVIAPPALLLVAAASSACGDAASSAGDAGVTDAGTKAADAAVASADAGVAFDRGPLVAGLDDRPTNATCLAPARPTPATPLAPRLSATGCVDGQDPRKPAVGLIPYGVNAPLWSDGAEKLRYLALPQNARIQIAADGDFVFPKGTVLVKTFSFGDRLVETRLFVRHQDGGWAGYTYEWNDAQTDATLLDEGKSTTVAGHDWSFPSRKVCLDCHSDAAGGSLGLEVAQLNGPLTYPGGRRANQLVTLEQLGLFEQPLGDVTKLPALPPPTGPAGTIEERARAYLHANCANCHRPNGLPADAQNKTEIDLRFTRSLAQTKTCNVVPGSKFGYDEAKILTPRDPDESMIVIRMKSRTPSVRMPAVGTFTPDDAGVTVLQTWIRSLVSCL